MDSSEYFDKIFGVKSVYEPDERFSLPFWEFASRFCALQRHWEFNKDYIRNHCAALEKIGSNLDDDYFYLFSETGDVDIEFLPTHLQKSAIVFSIALVEDLFGKLCAEARKESNVNIDEAIKPGGYIIENRRKLERAWGKKVEIEKAVWKSVDSGVALRNRFLHGENKEFSDHELVGINGLIFSTYEGEDSITNEDVDIVFSNLAKFVKSIEAAYWKFYEENLD